MQCDYLLRFQAERRINKSILLRKWPKNIYDVKDDAYKTPIFAYSKELDLLVLAISITRNDVEEENSPPCLEDVATYSEEETMNSKDTTLKATPQFATNSNKMNNPPMAPDST